MAIVDWQYESASDRVLGDVPGHDVDIVARLLQLPSGRIYLRHDQRRLELSWDGPHAVIGHSEADDEDLACAITEPSFDRSESICRTDLLQWTCSCCGVGLGRFTPAMHISREVAVEIFGYILTRACRPETCAEGPITWIEVDAD